MGFPGLVLMVVSAGLILSSCGDREPMVDIEIEFLDTNADHSEFERWSLDLIDETCQCRGVFENDLLKVPGSKQEKVVKVLQIWSGEVINGVSFHAGHRDQEPPLPPGRIAAPFRHDPERKGIIDQESIMGNSPIRIKEAMARRGHGSWGIAINFDPETASLMEKYTTANKKTQLAILLNGKILSMPVIAEPFSSGCAISGNFSEEEARGIAIGLRNPPPLKYRVREAD